MSLISEMKNKKEFTESYCMIADLILEKGSLILGMSVQEVARLSYTSPSTVVRFARYLGTSGFSEFKIRYAQELQQHYDSGRQVDANFPFSRTDSVRDIAASILKLNNESLMESYQLIYVNEKEFQKAAEQLASARNRFLIGVGFSYLCALSFQNHLIRIGYHFTIPSIPGEIDHVAEIATDQDAALILSYSGTTDTIQNSIRILKEKGTCIIGLTSNPDSPLTRTADIVLRMPEKERKFQRLANFSSQACMEYYLNILYSCMFLMNYEQNAKAFSF